MQAETPGQRGIAARRDGAAPGIGPQRNEAHRQHLARQCTADIDRPGQAVALRHLRPSSAHPRRERLRRADGQPHSVSAAGSCRRGRRSAPAAGHGRTRLTVVDGDGSSWWRVMQRSSPLCSSATMPGPAVRYGARPPQTTPAASPWRASASGARAPLLLPDQPAGSNARASWSQLALKQQTRLPPDLTADFRPATAFRPCLHDPAAPPAQIIQVCAHCLDAIPALLAAHRRISCRTTAEPSPSVTRRPSGPRRRPAALHDVIGNFPV